MKKPELISRKKVLILLLPLLLLTGLPRSFAEDVIAPIIDAITAPITDQPPVDTPVEPAASPAAQAAPTPTDSATPIADPVPTETAASSASPTPTPSPSPTPPHAVADQRMVINAPQVMAVDPRAHSFYLPQISAMSNGNLLICATTNLTGLDIGQSDIAKSDGSNSNSPIITGTNSSRVLISGIGNQAGYIFNGSRGARAFSTTRAVAGSYIHLQFVALSEPSVNLSLCSGANPSNNRTIYLRGLDLDLNMVKGDVRLK
jgi:hypothetical protein